MPGFVADASATLPWRFEDEATPFGTNVDTAISHHGQVRNSEGGYKTPFSPVLEE
jgi:hypothetical protein